MRVWGSWRERDGRGLVEETCGVGGAGSRLRDGLDEFKGRR